MTEACGGILSNDIRLFFDQQGSFDFEAKGIPTCAYPEGSVEKGTAQVYYNYDCDHEFLNVVYNQQYIRNDHERITSNYTFNAKDPIINGGDSLGSYINSKYHVTINGPEIILEYQNYSYSNYLKKYVQRKIIRRRTYPNQGWTWDLYYIKDGEDHYTHYFQGKFYPSSM